MKLPILWLIVTTVFASVAIARVGDSIEQIEEQLGRPTAISLDTAGYGLGSYRAAGFKEIRVTFVAGKSQRETYFIADEQAPREPVVAALQKENPEEQVFDGASIGIWVGRPEPEGELKFVTHTQSQCSFTGTLEMKGTKDEQRYAVVRTEDQVVEVYFAGRDVEFQALLSGMNCVVTTLDDNSEDLDVPLAVVGRREHIDWRDAVDDAHDSFQLLVKITSEGKTLFDRSICGVHGERMELRNAEVAYGLLIFDKSERFCQEHFPHAQLFTRGGCVVGEAKFAPVYVCASCVAACNEYKAAHPEPPRE